MQGQLNCEFKYATFSCKSRRSHQMDSEEKDISSILQQALAPAVRLVGCLKHYLKHFLNREAKF